MTTFKISMGLIVATAACGGGSSTSTGHTGDASRDGAQNVADASSKDVVTHADGGVLPVDSGADTSTVPPGSCASYQKYKQAFFGDLHTHTILSADAWGMGTRNEPVDAYEFARGAAKPIAAGAGAAFQPGPTVSIDRPLDFDAVTDHSEWIAVTYGCASLPDGGALDPTSPYGASCTLFTAEKDLSVLAVSGATLVLARNSGGAGGVEDQGTNVGVTESAWQVEQAAANGAYVPCTFTTFVAYEWTGSDKDTGGMLHKNVLFADDHVPAIPYDYLDYPEPTDLWTALDQGCIADAGCTAMTVPHNSNKSNGSAFNVPTTSEGVAQMLRYQKLVEIYQHKGSSECIPDGGATHDPKCAFEFLTSNDADAGTPDNADADLSNANSYVRTALENGLAMYADGGVRAADAGDAHVDPLMLGIIGATDDHNGLPGNVKESTWPGHLGDNDDTARLRLTQTADFSPGALTGVWAEENTRPSIFSALSRRETFATSGPRITVRLYQTWDASNPCGAAFPGNLIEAGAVPMGGQMTSPTGGATGPTFVVAATKDTTDLAEIDIIKGTLDASGQVVETVVPLSPSSPSSACNVWVDTTFAANPKAPSFYYARVLESETPRWSHYACQQAPTVAGCADGGGLDVMIQERAWTSPIWYLP